MQSEMITFNINPIETIIQNINDSTIEQIKNSISFFIDNEAELINFQKLSFCLSIIYNNKVSLSKDSINEIIVPTGLLLRIIQVLKQNKLSYQFINNIQPNIKIDVKNLSLKTGLRDAQKECIKAALTNKRGIIVSPTGTGKSWMIGEIIRQLQPHYNYYLIIVPTTDLLYQMQNDLANYLEIDKNNIGLIGDCNLNVEKITVALPNSLYNKVLKKDSELLSYLSLVNVALFDEAHCYCNATGIVINQSLKSTKYRIGFTATLEVAYPLLLEAIIGAEIKRITVGSEMAIGTIMTPEIQFHEVPRIFISSALENFRFSDFKPKELSIYNKIYDILICKNLTRNNLIVKLAQEFILKGEGPLLILVKKVGTSKNSKSKAEPVNHALIISSLLKQKGINLPIIHGSSEKNFRSHTIEQLKDYSIPGAIASSGILSEGLSIKSLSGLILAGAGSTEKDFIQRVGRTLRCQENKSRPQIFDFKDTQSIFKNQSDKRINTASITYPNCVSIIDLNGNSWKVT